MDQEKKYKKLALLWLCISFLPLLLTPVLAYFVPKDASVPSPIFYFIYLIFYFIQIASIPVAIIALLKLIRIRRKSKWLILLIITPVIEYAVAWVFLIIFSLLNPFNTIF